MTKHNTKTMTLGDAAFAYALCAERICGQDPNLFSENPAVVPIFVSHLFQSLEISIKHVVIESELFTAKEARSSTMRFGHGIEEIARLAVERLGGDEPKMSLLSAMTHNIQSNLPARDIIGKMIYGDEFKKTRLCYSSRCLGYAEVKDGDFAIAQPIKTWIDCIKQTASNTNLDSAIEIIKQWKASPSQSKHFAIWYKRQ